MKLIDSHSHIYQKDFDDDLYEVVERARQAGISHIFMPNIDVESIDRMLKLSMLFPGYCIPMMGLHPTSVKEDFGRQLDSIRHLFSKQTFAAVGEIGIDLYWDKTYIRQQQEAFETQLQWSIELDLPVVIHHRQSLAETVESICKVGADRLRGVFHSFGGNREELETILALENFYIGINGTLTFKNSKLEETIRYCPIEKIVLETDAPYLSPVPYRGKRNEPAYIQNTAARLAGIFGLDTETTGLQTSANALKLFGWS